MKMQVEVPTISVVEAQNRQALYIDVRTPKEFEHFCILNASHVPLFLNDEHAQVGTIYNQEGKEQATEIGLNHFARKLPDLYQQFKAIHREHRDKLLIVYCWRGGMRSKSIVSVMSGLGIPVIQLEGGIRAYRQRMLKQIEELTTNKPFIVLSGNTGTKKTDILLNLAEKGYPVIDLEGLANHRGSAFGHIGKKPSNQKQFEQGLCRRLQELEHANYYIIEAESRRIGAVHLPDAILKGKDNGTRIHIEADLALRIETICDMYPLEKHYEQFMMALVSIEKRLPSQIAYEAKEHMKNHDVTRVVELLLNHYYDPRYLHSTKKNKLPICSLKINNLEDGVTKVEQAIIENT